MWVFEMLRNKDKTCSRLTLEKTGLLVALSSARLLAILPRFAILRILESVMGILKESGLRLPKDKGSDFYPLLGVLPTGSLYQAKTVERGY
tara:strand:- start:6568 stop:6840 length:273 start_codon:yes stop_codon:yes gene_type:complete